MPDPLRIAYLVEDTALSGGVRVQVAQADALIARGHRVRLVTKGLPLTWRPSQAEWIYVDDFQQYDTREDDFVIGTFWGPYAPPEGPWYGRFNLVSAGLACWVGAELFKGGIFGR